jgi:hypothetical protein
MSLLRDLARYPNALTSLWGLTVGLATALLLLRTAPAHWVMNDGRDIRLRDSMRVLSHGGPLLLGRHGPGGHYYAVDFGDDEGAFVYIPLLSRLFGVTEPVSMVRDLYIVLVSLTAALYPTIFYRLTRSLWAALVAPFLFVVCMRSMGFIDVYWISAWGALTLFPLIFLLARDWPRFGIVAIGGLALGAGWLTSIRSYSCLGIAVAATIVLLLQRWRWWRLLPALAMVALLYVSITAFVFPAIRADRDHRLGSAAKTVDLTSGHTLWHTAYAGLGYLPNKYGMRFLDGVPRARVEREAPGTPFLSSRYETIIRRAYFQFIGEHPRELIRQYSAKAIVVIADLFPYLLIVLLTLPAMLLVGPERRIARRWSLLAVPGVIVAFLPVVLALPMKQYEQDLYGVIGVVGITGLCWMLKLTEAAIRKRGRASLTAPGASESFSALAHGRTPGWRAARVSVVATVVLIALTFGGYFVRREADRWQGGPSGALMEEIGG